MSMNRRNALKTMGLLPLAGSPLAALGQTSSINDEPKSKPQLRRRVQTHLINAHQRWVFEAEPGSKVTSFQDEDSEHKIFVVKDKDDFTQGIESIHVFHSSPFVPKTPQFIENQKTDEYQVYIECSPQAFPRVEIRRINDSFFWRLTARKYGVEFDCDLPDTTYFADIQYLDDRFGFYAPKFGTRPKRFADQNEDFTLEVVQGRIPYDQYFHKLPKTV